MRTKYFAFAALAAMLASCSNDEDFAPQNDLKDMPITVTAGVAALNSRAGHDNNNLPATFYLTVTQDAEDENSQYNYTNEEMTKGDNGKYTSSNDLLWKDADRDAAVSAYTIDGTDFTVQTDQSTTANVIASDLLGAVSTTTDDVTISGDNIGINFRHLLCKLDVTFTWGTEFGNVTKTITGVTYNGFGTDVTLNRATSEVTEGSTTGDIQAYVAEMKSEAIFAPQNETPKITISTTIDGEDRTFSLNVTPPIDGFASGICYTMNVTIGGAAVESNTFSLTVANGWETGTTENNGNMKTE